MVSVRMVPSGRGGRYAVIYLNSMSDVSRAVAATAGVSGTAGILSGTEAHVYLAEELIEE